MKQPRVFGQVTRFQMGSLRELFSISLPLMLSLGSIAMMVFWDRFFLARLSSQAFAAAAEGAMFFIIFEYSLVSMALTAEIYVGRFYGSGRDQELARPCWAMVWMSLISGFLLIPFGYYLGDLFFHGSCYPELSNRFFRSLLYFWPLFGINMALSSFWIGRGKTVFVTACTVLANLINIGLDPLFIFGFWGFPRLEIEGAGIATGISQLVQTGIYFIAFLRKENREKYNTGLWRFDIGAIRDCCTLGMPLVITIFVQACAWMMIARVMSLSGEETLLVWGVVHTAFMLNSFIGDAVGRAGTAITANLIGAGKISMVSKMMRSGIRLHILIFSCIAIVFYIYQDFILSLFILDYYLLEPARQIVLCRAMMWNILITFFEALFFLWTGVLMALEDAIFLGVTGSILIWLLAVIPAGIAAMLGATGDIIIASTILYYIGTGVLYYMRCVTKIQSVTHIDASNPA